MNTACASYGMLPISIQKPRELCNGGKKKDAQKESYDPNEIKVVDAFVILIVDIQVWFS